ncbi:glutamine-synthetase adenylyltransferase [Cypionkella sp.]|uniref:[protein-PII] uridylyltransferase family protein n=1 Tax=Cypionkella sp. TaxID=2811411 RepID=UPI00271C684C|nr:glutamine-synthetase adenylyltransferase [Cypionkella sp.]MDO8983932.1 glutamine-synthetase adenylyltransferase [Cypionkella sp.]MDP2049455.1 glutamine-synthetase adenylyltransferase [Cypionkella sp.]
MSQNFAARITRQPIAYDRDQAADIATSFADLAPDLRGLLANTAGCSPYLKALMLREAQWLRVALTLAPETAFAGVLVALHDVALDQLPNALRQAKRRAALLTALADLGGVWSLMQVTGALTDLADRAVDLAMQRLVADEIRRGKLPGATPDDAATAGGMVSLAMGKMGAGELNYSSDIDLICLFDQDRYGDDWQDARAAFIRVTRKMAVMLSDITAEGYVFRTDLRLRPDASVMPVCLSMAAAEAYYEAQGRTWERAAYIKARPCGGDLAAGNRFLKALTPFVWRKHLDFAAIQDAHDMRLRIREHRGLNGAVTVEGHNMKLGQGGIREIEFFTQTRQLIAGGRDVTLRDRTTLGGLKALAAKDWLPPEVATDLSQLYTQHRELEHRIQMVNDEQTHNLPTSAEGIARIAAFCGQDEASFRTDLLDRLSRTDRLTEGFFAPSAVEAGPELSDHAAQIVKGWSSYPALRSDRAQAIFLRLRPVLLKRLTRAANPDEALVALDGFLAGLPSGVQIFSLFEANPQLVDLIIDIAGTAPALARYLSRNASVLDAVIGGAFFAAWPTTAALIAELSKRLDDIPDYERKLDAARRWMKEWHFRIGVHHLRGLIDGFEAGKQYADLAEAVIAALWPVVCADFALKHGQAPGRGAVVLGMGSLGAGRLNAGSDLDLIMIYDAAGVENSDGKRPLAARPYYARLTQAMVTALSAQMAEGRLYEVDVRLRPSGRQGPVATSIESFRNYQTTEAWTWEHLALTRARVLAGEPTLAAEVEAFRRETIASKGQGATVLKDVADMRARLAEAKPGAGGWDAKFGPGRMMDIELLAQTVALQTASPARGLERQIAAGGQIAGKITGGTLAKLSHSDQSALLDAYRLCWQMQAASKLLSDKPLDPETLGLGGRAFLLREANEATTEALTKRLARVAALAEQVISAHLNG